MDEQVLNIIEGLIEGRNIFLGRTINQISHTERGIAYNHFLRNELCYLEFVSRIFTNGIRTAQPSLVLNLPSNFLDQVPVVASPEQIRRAVETVQDIRGICAICQDGYLRDASRIRHCSHTYHSDCLASWLSMSVRCPVCRHDVRELEGPPNQTSPDEE